MKNNDGVTPPLQNHFYRSLIFLIELIIIAIVSSCSSAAIPQPVSQTATEPPVLETYTAAPSFTPAFTPTDLPTPTYLPTNTQIPTETPTATPTPTYTILRGEVLMLANCRYGPGAPYLYKYALIEGSNLEIIGRNDLGTWILVQAIGGHNPCWVKASLMKIKGDVMDVAPTYIPLPQSPYYGPPSGVSATRNGNEVIVSWNEFPLRAGDDSEQFPFLVEAWVCKDGQEVFTPLGSYATTVTILDERGCATPSHARLYAVEKHGYTKWVEIPWPQPN
jgi:hypothetical protein